MQLAIEQSQGMALIDVIDDGPGIPAERRASVFARFHREAGTHGDGFGLGLSIAQAIVAAHHGTITIESAVGLGTTVRVTLPLDT